MDGAVTDLLELRVGRVTRLRSRHQPADHQAAWPWRQPDHQPIHCAGVTVRPGDLVLADDNGVLFLDPAIAQSVIERALASDRAEPQLLTRLMAGEPVASVLSIKLS